MYGWCALLKIPTKLHERLHKRLHERLHENISMNISLEVATRIAALPLMGWNIKLQVPTNIRQAASRALRTALIISAKSKIRSA
jgi:hypothetical protein